MSFHSDFWSPDSVEYVTDDIIQEAFNKGQFVQRLTHRQLQQRVFNYDTHLNRRQRQALNRTARLETRATRCTRSQMVLYYSLDGMPVALVHQYRRPDGTLAASGKPDPKRLFFAGRVIAVRQSP